MNTVETTPQIQQIMQRQPGVKELVFLPFLG